jgi:FMN phosphatase YigB (HAD superfamily)
MGYRLAAVSNAADDANTQALVDKLGARPYLEFVLSSAQYGTRKPNPKIFRSALERLSVPADRAVMVGDTLGADILGAHNSGIYAIWITRRANTPANRAHADTIKPDARIANLNELPTYGRLKLGLIKTTPQSQVRGVDVRLHCRQVEQILEFPLGGQQSNPDHLGFHHP